MVVPTRIVIVGGGFSGTVLAGNLLRRPPATPTEIVLIERAAEIGRGVAYAVHEFPYLLNVPAGRLSADSADPLQFLRYAQRTLPHGDAEDFLPRRLYGEYLQDFLARAEQAAPRHVSLTRVFGEATRLSHGGAEPLAVGLADRESIEARRVILALGNPPPPMLPWAAPVRRHAAYREDPWRLPSNLRKEHSVLIIGNGLTMVDVAISLSRDSDHAPQLITISRRGLIPLTQSAFHATAMKGDGSGLLDCAGSIRQVFAASRAMARDVAQLGGDWREVVTYVRNLAPRIWQRLPEAERRRFVRHLQGYWDVHRHRLPPESAAHIDRLRRSGGLQVNAGRIEELTPAGERLRVTWRRRGSTLPAAMTVDAVINAIGPDYSFKRSPDRFFNALRSDGWVREDDLDLGLRTGLHGACIAADGSASKHLFYLGPMLRANHWEATAAAELRNHAEQLAGHLVSDAP